MKIVLQRVKQAAVTVDGRTLVSISRGYVLFAGIAAGDDAARAVAMAGKISRLRIFEDASGRMNLDIREAGGEILSIPQFTLLGDTRKGNRPGFDDAADPDTARRLWEEFNAALVSGGISVKEGSFASHMLVDLVNDGPVTFIIEK